MPTHTVFYSWQSDLPNTCNRGFIHDCLESAINQIKSAEQLELDPSLDRDTKGASGSADIAGTIFTKIRAADVFVGDVSIINFNRPAEQRPTPNPNVLAELGYAAGLHGWERVLCLLNTAFGEIEDLPFDIRQRKVVAYKLHPGEDRTAKKKELAGILRGALVGVLAPPHLGPMAQSETSLLCPLTEDEYDLPVLHVHANEYQRIVLGLENPLEKTLDSVHVCYKKFDLFYMPWRHKARPTTDPIAGGYSYYWLTDNQLQDLGKKTHQKVHFILNGRQCGEHDLMVVWKAEGKAYQRRIKVVVKPRLG
jgi:hypothetical protein